jgi:hypothetical protein
LLARRTVWTLAFTAYRLWRSVPPEQRRRIVEEAKKHGPRVARGAADKLRKPPKR